MINNEKDERFNFKVFVLIPIFVAWETGFKMKAQ